MTSLFQKPIPMNNTITPGYIHFWLYDDVTDNCILDLQRKISIRAAIILVPFIYPIRPPVSSKRTSEEHVRQKKEGMCHCNAEKNLPKVNSTVVFFMHSEWSRL